MITKRTMPVYTTSDNTEHTSLGAAQEHELKLLVGQGSSAAVEECVPVSTIVAKAEAVIAILRMGPRSRAFTATGKPKGRPKGSRNKPKATETAQAAEPATP